MKDLTKLNDGDERIYLIGYETGLLSMAQEQLENPNKDGDWRSLIDRMMKEKKNERGETK